VPGAALTGPPSPTLCPLQGTAVGRVGDPGPNGAVHIAPRFRRTRPCYGSAGGGADNHEPETVPKLPGFAGLARLKTLPQLVAKLFTRPAATIETN